MTSLLFLGCCFSLQINSPVLEVTQFSSPILWFSYSWATHFSSVCTAKAIKMLLWEAVLWSLKTPENKTDHKTNPLETPISELSLAGYSLLHYSTLSPLWLPRGSFINCHLLQGKWLFPAWHWVRCSSEVQLDLLYSISFPSSLSSSLAWTSLIKDTWSFFLVSCIFHHLLCW